jgi:hypothetical protein
MFTVGGSLAAYTKNVTAMMVAKNSKEVISDFAVVGIRLMVEVLGVGGGRGSVSGGAARTEA